MKVKVIKDYNDEEYNRLFEKCEELKVENNENSDFYHIWEENKLFLIPKDHCVKV